jgi:quercetin 2,3-dioxygenase
MDMEIRRSNQRGHAEHGWLDSRHTFSFADYHDPRHMGFGHLRVINQDRVDPGQGFGTHSHRNMEIVSYVLEGSLAHRDTLGTGAVIRPGEIQLMSAGRGIAHSEMNGSKTDPVRFLQIWVLPREGNTEPGYQQREIPDRDGLVLLVSPDGRDGSLTIRQDTDLWRLRVAAGQTVPFAPKRSRVWIQVVRGQLEVAGVMLNDGDGLSITDARDLVAVAHSDLEALIFDLL